MAAAFGDILPSESESSTGFVDETPQSEASDAAGSPPDERGAAPSETVDTPEGTQAAALGGTPPSAAAPAVPDVGTPEPDPLAGATPLTYNVNGEARTFDGVQVLPGGGAIVMPDAVAQITQRLSERDNLHARDRARYEEVQTYDRLSQWTSTAPDGTEQTLTGLQGLEAMRVHTARKEAEIEVIGSYFADPDKLAELFLGRDENTGKWQLDPKALRSMAMEARLAADDRERHVRTAIGTLRTPPKSESAPQRTDWSQHAPSVIANAAGQNVTKLTDADRKELSTLLPRFVRTVTEQDRAGNPSLVLGAPIIDGQFRQVVASRVALREELLRTSATTVQAATVNAARQAAAAAGQRPAPVTQLPPARAAAAPSPTVDQDARWDLMERMQRASSGR